jgi:thioredoxin-related protein
VKAFSLVIILLFSGFVFAQNSNSEYDSADEDLSEQEDGLPPVEIKELKDFAQTLAEARRDGKIILLEMSATYCGYCRTLEAEIIKPMLRSGDYEQNVMIRRLHIDGYYPMKDIDGKMSSPAEIANQLNIFVTPTLLFLDGNGREASKRIIGVNTLEFYGGYVDMALEEGLQTLGKHLRTP